MTNLTDILEKSLLYIAEMQKLADTKNAGLIALNGVVVIGCVTLMVDKVVNPILFYYLLFVVITGLISTFLSLASIVAKIRHKATDVSLHKSDNLLFFGTISQMNSKELVKNLVEKYSLNDDQPALNKDLAKQCIIMAQIAVRKFKLFNTAFLWTVSGIASPLSTLIFLLFYNPNKH